MKKNIRFFWVVFALILAVPLLYAGTIILDFDASPGFNKVLIKWTTQNEINLKGFEIQRSFDVTSDRNFKAIHFEKASKEQKAKKDYTYEDKSVFKSASRTYHYRLKIVDLDDSFSYSKTITVTPTVSSARQTWGSIKAMFR